MVEQSESGPDSKSELKAAAQQQVERARHYLMRFEMPQRLMLVGSGLAFLFGIFNWYAVKTPFGSQGVGGFQPWHGKLFFLTSLATVLLLTVPGIRQPLLGKQTEQVRKLIFLGLVGGSFVFGPVWFMLSMGDAPSMSFGETGMSAGKTLWFWLAFLAAGTAVAGGVMGMKQESGDRA